MQGNHPTSQKNKLKITNNMNTATKTPELLNIGQATADQLGRFIILKSDNSPQILTAWMDSGHMIVCRRSKAGYFVRRTYDQYGECLKTEAFRNWNETDHYPYNPVKFTE
jgi:hypothetical protein